MILKTRWQKPNPNLNLFCSSLHVVLWQKQVKVLLELPPKAKLSRQNWEFHRDKNPFVLAKKIIQPINPFKPFNAEPKSTSPKLWHSNRWQIQTNFWGTDAPHHVWPPNTEARLTGSVPFPLRVRVRQQWRQIHPDRLTARTARQVQSGVWRSLGVMITQTGNGL